MKPKVTKMYFKIVETGLILVRFTKKIPEENSSRILKTNCEKLILFNS